MSSLDIDNKQIRTLKYTLQTRRHSFHLIFISRLQTKVSEIFEVNNILQANQILEVMTQLKLIKRMKLIKHLLKI